MTAEPSRAQLLIGDFAPKLVELTDDLLFGDIWERPGLSKRDRSLVTVATLVALYRTDQMEGHMNRAIDNGLTLDELIEAIAPHRVLRRLAERDDRDYHGQETLWIAADCIATRHAIRGTRART